jgi:hypothetical protein
MKVTAGERSRDIAASALQPHKRSRSRLQVLVPYTYAMCRSFCRHGLSLVRFCTHLAGPQLQLVLLQHMQSSGHPMPTTHRQENV